MTERSKQTEVQLAEAVKTRQQALEALRKGDFDFALHAVERGEASIPELVEDLKIYQAELEIQNEELRNAQQLTEKSRQRFFTLFSSLPLPALVIDEFGVVSECNDEAVECFNLDRKRLRSHFFPRLVLSKQHARLRRAIEHAKVNGEESLREVAMQPVEEAKSFIADIHFSLLPDPESEQTNFVVMVVDQTERLQHEAQIEDSQRHFMAYFDASPVGMTATSPEKGWLEVNDRLCQMLGYRREELKRMTWLELTHPDDIDADVGQFNEVLSGKIDSYNLDKRFIRKDGTVLETHLAVSCVRNSKGEVDYFVAILEDINARKQAERQLEHNEKLLSERVKELRAIYTISKVSQNTPEIASFLDKVVELLPSGMAYPADTAVCIRVDGQGCGTPDFESVQPKLSATILVLGNEVGMLQVGYRQVHEEKELGPFYREEQALIEGVAEIIGRHLERVRESEARLLTMRRNLALLNLTTSSAGLSDMDLVRHAIDELENLTKSGIAYAHFVNADQETISLGVWSSRTLNHCEASFDTHYPISKAGIWADCFRLRRPVIHNHYPSYPEKKGLPLGHAELLRHMSAPVMEGDKVTMIIGVGNKDNEYDDADLSLLEMMSNTIWSLLQRNRSHRRLQLDAEVFRISREGVMITDSECRIISVNEAFTEITGYSNEEAIGQTPRLLKSGRQTDDFYKEMWAKIKLEGRWQGEIWNRRKNGEVFPQWLGISASPDEQGRVKEYVGIFMDVSEHQKAQEHIEQLAFYDSLTGLANRRLLADRAQQAISFAKRQKCMVGLIYLDLDHFKEVNDSMGHLVGDELLMQVAARLKACVRDTDTVSRMGGDEFVVLLNDMISTNDVVEVAQKILEKMIDPVQFNHRTLKVSCSVGASLYPMDGDNFDTLLQGADTAMYQAKSAGRNTFRLFTEEMNQRVQQSMMLRTDMQRALLNNEFFVEYQPQFDIHTLRVIGSEALVRWRHPSRGIVSPGEFIPMAEESGMIVDIGHFVMREACKQTKRWLDAGHSLSIAVNVSYVQFARNNLLQLVNDALLESGLPSQHLELELTESILMADTESIITIVDELSKKGVFLAIDDFGTGYSSLSYLKRLPVHKLKIDQSFVRDIVEDRDDRSIVSAITNLARSLEMSCIAEGVETQEQAHLLRNLGCEQIQGYWLAKPLSVSKMDDLLELSKA